MVFKFSQTLNVIMASVLKECVHLRDVHSHWNAVICTWHLFTLAGKREREKTHDSDWHVHGWRLSGRSSLLTYLRTEYKGAGKVACQLRTLAALTGDSISVPSSDTESHNHQHF